MVETDLCSLFFCLSKWRITIYSTGGEVVKFSNMKRKETRNRRNPKSMLKGQKKGKPTKDKRHFNGTAVNHKESALRRETHKGKGKRSRTLRTKAALCQKYICEHYWAGYPFNNSSFVCHLLSIYIIQMRESM